MRSSFSGYVITFLVIALSIGINLGQHVLDSLNMNRSYMLISLIAIAVAGLLVHRKMLFIFLVAGLSLAVNLPEERLLAWHIDKVILVATLISLVLMPIINKQMGLEAR